MDTLRPTGAIGAGGASGNGEERAGLPATARAASLPELPAACRVSDALTGHLAALGPDVEARLEPDGRVTLTMPATWASLYLATIRAQAETMRERLRRADQEAKVREAEQHVQSGEPARAWQAEQAAIFAQYQQLVGGGVSHREALHRLKAQAGGRLTVTDLEEVVRAAGARERRQQRGARAERIRRTHAEGASAEQIGEREGLTRDQVKACLRRGSVPLAAYGVKAAQRERRDAILALHRQGMMPREIVARTGLTLPQIMMAIKGVPRGTARPGVSVSG